MQASTSSSSFHHPDLTAATTHKNNRVRSWANRVNAELAEFASDHPADAELLHWYFNTFCTGWGFNGKHANGDHYTCRHRLTPLKVADHLGVVDGTSHFFGVSPSVETLWACVDIDTGSRYHPASDHGEGLEPVLASLRSAGLKYPIEFQSSHSTGIHLWYALAEPVNSWQLAKSLDAAAKNAKLQVNDGVLELFPNLRSYNSAFKCIRAPLSGEGNAFWVHGLDLDDSLAVFRHLFINASGHNKFTPVELESQSVSHSSSYTGAKNGNNNDLLSIRRRLKEGFTAIGQTNEIQLFARIIARCDEGIDNVPDLRRRLIELVASAPGYGRYCQHQRTIENGTYWSDSCLRKTLELSPSDYQKSHWKKANDKSHKKSTYQALQALQRAIDDGKQYRTRAELFSSLRADYGAPSERWWRKYKQYKMAAVNLLLDKDVITDC